MDWSSIILTGLHFFLLSSIAINLFFIQNHVSSLDFSFKRFFDAVRVSVRKVSQEDNDGLSES